MKRFIDLYCRLLDHLIPEDRAYFLNEGDRILSTLSGKRLKGEGIGSVIGEFCYWPGISSCPRARRDS